MKNLGKNLYKYVFFGIGLLVLFSFSSCKKEKDDKRTFLQIKSTPEGAKVILMGKDAGVTPSKGKVPSGTHIIKLEKENYEPYWEKIVCPPKGSKIIDAKLKPITASVLIESIPSKSKILMNGQVIGETPMTVHGQTIGKHEAIVSRHGYINKKIEWEVIDFRPQKIVAKLSSNLGSLEFNSVPSHANIFIDDKPRGHTPFKGSLEAGKHKIKITMNGYSVYEQSLVISRNKKMSKTARLQMLPGVLKLSSSPAGAQVFVNGRQYENAPTTIKNLKPGNYKVEFRKGGHDPVIREVKIYAGQTASVSARMDSNTGAIHLVTSPPGITIYLDGRKVGVTELGEHKKISKVFVVPNVSMGNHTLTAAHKRAIPNTKSFKVKIKKGETLRLRNIKMWIANAVLILKKDGKRMEGRLASEAPDYILFEIEPGVTQHYDKTEIKSLTPLKKEE
jgi:hypothetical protein